MRAMLVLFVAGLALGALLPLGGGGGREVEPEGRESTTVALSSPEMPVTTGATSLESELTELVHALPPRESTGVIEGIVRSERGAPLAGVSIELIFVAPEAAADASLVDRIATRWTALPGEGGDSLATQSDAEGRFHFGSLPRASFRLEVEQELAGSVVDVSPAGLVSPTGAPGATSVEVVITRAVPVRFDVRYPDDTIPTHATLVLGERSLPWSSESHYFASLGKLSFTVIVDGRPHRFERSIGEPRVERPVEVVLPYSGGVALSVMLPEPMGEFFCWWAVPPGRVIDAAWVLRHASRYDGFVGRAVEQTLPSTVGIAQRERAPSETGEETDRPITETIELTGLPPAEYLIAVGRSRESIDAWEIVSVGEQIVAAELAVAPAETAPGLAAVVLDAAGVPVEEVVFSLSWHRADTVDELRLTSVRQEDGSWWLRPEALAFDVLDRRVDGVLRLEVWTGTHGVRLLDITSRFIEVYFRELAMLRVGLDGLEEGARAQVTIRRRGGRSTAPRGIVGSNTVVFGPMEVGEVEVWVQGFASFTAIDWVDPVAVSLASGENEVIVALPPLYALEVDFPAADEFVYVSLIRRDGGTGRAPIGRPYREGTVTFDGVLAGEYSLEVIDRAGRVRTRSVSIPRETHISFSAPLANAFLLRFPVEVIDGSFRDGDVIYGVDGRSFETTGDFGDAFHWRKRELLPILVERAGREIVVRASLAQLQLLQGRGMEMVPTVRE